MNSEQLSANIVESTTMFGELYEWNKCSIPHYLITSLLITDDLSFSSTDLTIICEMSPLRQLFLHNLISLEFLPPTIARLKDLKVLSITHCDALIELPLAVKFLFKLETLRIDCPNLHELPAFLCLMPSLNLILLRKSIAICAQCKQHLKKSSRIIILPELPETSVEMSKTICNEVVSLSVLSANSYISHFSSSLFYQTIPFRMLWPSLEAALILKMNRCIICLINCSKSQSISISFTRFLNCKCIHLNGFLCSQSCLLILQNYLRTIHPNADIFTSAVPQIIQPQLNIVHPLTSTIVRRRIKKILCQWTGCIPHFRKKSYTVNAR